jgi:type IV pilus assembly protein PilC
MARKKKRRTSDSLDASERDETASAEGSAASPSDEDEETQDDESEDNDEDEEEEDDDDDDDAPSRRATAAAPPPRSARQIGAAPSKASPPPAGSRSLAAKPKGPAPEEASSDKDEEEAGARVDDDAPGESPARALPQRARLTHSRSLRPPGAGRPASSPAPAASLAAADDDDDDDEAPAPPPRAPRVRIAEEPEEAPEESVSSRLDSLLRMKIGGGRPGLGALAHFARKLSALITAGIPLVRCLKLLADRTSQGELRAATEAVARDVESGSSLSDSMRRHPSVFDPLVISVVQIGEIGGILEESLRRLSEILERKATVRKQVTAAATYPLVLGLLAIAAVVVIMLTIVPQFEASFAEMDMELPPPTLFVIDISRHLQNYWHVDLLILVAVFLLLRRYATGTRTGQRLWEGLQLRLPAIGRIVQLVNSARFCRTLGGLLAAGIPLWESLGVAAETSESVLVSENLQRVRDAVEKGQKLEPTLREAHCFMPEMLDIVGIGEETGMLDKMLLSMAGDYEQEIEARLTTLIELLKPLLLIIIGGCIVLILIAVYMPYFNLVKGIAE